VSRESDRGIGCGRNVKTIPPVLEGISLLGDTLWSVPVPILGGRERVSRLQESATRPSPPSAHPSPVALVISGSPGCGGSALGDCRRNSSRTRDLEYVTNL
jgi:hypothetical protein